MKSSLGIDFGTNSCRAIIVDCKDGRELGCGVYEYQSGNNGVILSTKDATLARQNPLDYLKGLLISITDAVADAKKRNPDWTEKSVCGIGVDTTGSSPLPLCADNSALGTKDEFKDNPNAQCWLWKDHTSVDEANEITALAKKIRPNYLSKCGGTYSSEWWWSKILHCLRTDKKVFDAAYSWAEIADWIPSVLAGVKDPTKIVRGICAAGHKAMYSEQWGGLPDDEFLSKLSVQLTNLKTRLYKKAYPIGKSIGGLCEEWAKKLGLAKSIPIAIGGFDVHFGSIACGIKEGVLVKAVGTSTCDCTVKNGDCSVPEIKGICGIVDGSILPNCYGIEAGQSAVGDIFKWWVETILCGDACTYAKLGAEAAKQKVGASGLVALDWNNGNRTVLVDQRLTGLLVGQTLQTTKAEIYRALIEATAYGAKIIIDRFEENNIDIERVVCCGGISQKDALAMQIYADVFNKEILIAESPQTCALGAAIVGAVAGGAFKNFAEAQKLMCRYKKTSFKPIPENVSVYIKLFEIYKMLHDNFGGVWNADLSSVMKDLLQIKQEARK